MAPSAGFNSTVKISGTPTAFTGEACSVVSAGSVYQITDTTKRIVDPATAVVVKDNGVTKAASLYVFDYLFGKVTFVGYTASGPVTVDGAFIPVLSVVDARSYSINRSRALLDSTSFDFAAANQAARRYTAGLLGADGEIEVLDITDPDLDPGAGSVLLDVLADAGTPKLIEMNLGGTGYYFRAWVLLEGINREAPADALMKKTVKWRSAAIVGSGQTETASFGIGQ